MLTTVAASLVESPFEDIVDGPGAGSTSEDIVDDPGAGSTSEDMVDGPGAEILPLRRFLVDGVLGIFPTIQCNRIR
jgi:hypothetical protein